MKQSMTTKEKIIKCVFKNQEHIEILIQILIIASIFQASLETMPNLKYKYKTFWDLSEKIFVAVFSLEYLARIYFSKRKLKFVFSFYGFVDIISILPSIILSMSSLDFRFVRVLRFLKFFRILKLARYSKALGRFKDSFLDIKEELIVFFCLNLILLYMSATGIYYFEHEAQPEIFKSIPHSLWWSVATLTTVGYGDIYPITTGGKIFTFLILIIGIGIISVPSGLFASSFSRNKE